MEKTCYQCGQCKELSQFGKNKSRKDGVQARCRDCDRTYHARLYKNNPKRYVQLRKESRNRKSQWFQELKKTYKCSKCGDDRWYVIEFHHTKGKDEAISNMISNNASKSRIMEEIKKCTPLCSNCHKEEHFLANNRGLKIFD